MADMVARTQALMTRLRLEQLGGLAWLPVTSAPRAHPPLMEWEQAVKTCRRCRLCEGRHHTVFGEGSPHASVMFVGEGPGMEEDLQGRPFVGAAGALLTKIIQALGLSREHVYITNMVKCRPPQNRVPLPDELASCRRYLDAQIALVRPRVICTLGRTAANALLQIDAPVGALRGQRHLFGDIPVIVTYHPAHLLRHPEAKRETWADVRQLLPYLRRGR